MRGANTGSKVKAVGGGYLCETPHLGEIRVNKANKANGANMGEYGAETYFSLKGEIVSVDLGLIKECNTELMSSHSDDATGTERTTQNEGEGMEQYHRL